MEATNHTINKYAAFLRAINVGGHTVKMDILRGLFEAMRFSNVETFIASGNVIFDSASQKPRVLEGKIEENLQVALGYQVATFIRLLPELARIAETNPFKYGAEEGSALYIAFLANAPSPKAVQNLMSFMTSDDAFHVEGREIYWLCRKKMSESEFSGALLEKILGMQATLRNSNTIKKIISKYS